MEQQTAVEVGMVLRGPGGRRGRRIGIVDAVFADYLLVRTASLLPVDLYVPRLAVSTDAGLRVDCSPAEAYERWHRPLKRAPHD